MAKVQSREGENRASWMNLHKNFGAANNRMCIDCNDKATRKKNRFVERTVNTTWTTCDTHNLIAYHLLINLLSLNKINKNWIDDT